MEIWATQDGRVEKVGNSRTCSRPLCLIERPLIREILGSLSLPSPQDGPYQGHPNGRRKGGGFDFPFLLTCLLSSLLPFPSGSPPLPASFMGLTHTFIHKRVLTPLTPQSLFYCPCSSYHVILARIPSSFCAFTCSFFIANLFFISS